MSAGYVVRGEPLRAFVDIEDNIDMHLAPDLKDVRKCYEEVGWVMETELAKLREEVTAARAAWVSRELKTDGLDGAGATLRDAVAQVDADWFTLLEACVGVQILERNPDAAMLRSWLAVGDQSVDSYAGAQIVLTTLIQALSTYPRLDELHLGADFVDQGRAILARLPQVRRSFNELKGGARELGNTWQTRLDAVGVTLERWIGRRVFAAAKAKRSLPEIVMPLARSALAAGRRGSDDAVEAQEPVDGAAAAAAAKPPGVI